MIEFRNVSKIYNNGTEALHNVDLKVEKGEFVFIVGSSGAGKSTFLKLVMCEEHPSKGQILIDGQDVSRIRKGKIPAVRRKMGIVFQDFRLIDQMTVYDNVAFAMRVVGASARTIKKRVPYILGLVGLQHKAKHFPTELSGGEKQRVGLARALVNNPSMIVADEPTGNIDPALSFEIVDLLNEINRRGTTILMVTHEHSLVKLFHRRIIQIHSGEVVADTSELTKARETGGEELDSTQYDEPGTDDSDYEDMDEEMVAETEQGLDEAGPISYEEAYDAEAESAGYSEMAHDTAYHADHQEAGGERLDNADEAWENRSIDIEEEPLPEQADDHTGGYDIDLGKVNTEEFDYLDDEDELPDDAYIEEPIQSDMPESEEKPRFSKRKEGWLGRDSRSESGNRKRGTK